jgi:hypothetical protein
LDSCVKGNNLIYFGTQRLEASPNPSEGGELGTDIVNIVDIVIDIIIEIVINNILEPLSWPFFSPYSRYPSASALKRAGCSLLSGLF